MREWRAGAHQITLNKNEEYALRDLLESQPRLTIKSGTIREFATSKHMQSILQKLRKST